MTQSDNAVEVQIVFSCDLTEVLAARLDIVQCSRPTAAFVADAPIFETPGCKSRLIQSDAQMTDVIEIVSGTPKAAVNNDHDRIWTATIGQTQLPELQRVTAVANAHAW